MYTIGPINYGPPVIVKSRITAQHYVTVPELDEIEHRHKRYGVCTLFVDFQLTLCYGVPAVIAPPVSASTMLARGHAPALGPMSRMSVIRVLRYPRCVVYIHTLMWVWARPPTSQCSPLQCSFKGEEWLRCTYFKVQPDGCTCGSSNEHPL